MERIYYIPKTDRQDAEKTAAVNRCCAENVPSIGADGVKQYPGAFCGPRVLTAFGDVPDVITVEWCRQFVSLAQDITGEEIEHILVDHGPKKAHYWVKSNCLRLLDADGCYYENNNGVVCRDRVAIADGR